MADDHQIVVDGIRQLLQDCEDILFVGSNIDGFIACDEIIKLKPDIALIDLRMPGKDGLQIINSVKKEIDCKMVILSMYAESRFINDARKYGADGYLLKNIGRAELMSTLHLIYGGQKIFHKPINEEELNEQVFITPREKDVILLIIEGLNTNQISEKLNLSIETVRTHRKNIMRKTNAGNVAGLIKFINGNNLI